MNVRTIQFDNHLIDAGFTCLVYESKSCNTSELLERSGCQLQFERELSHPFDVHVFNTVQVILVSLNIILEEKIVLKVIQMLLPPSVMKQTGEEDIRWQSSSSRWPHLSISYYCGLAATRLKRFLIK